MNNNYFDLLPGDLRRMVKPYLFVCQLCHRYGEPAGTYWDGCPGQLPRLIVYCELCQDRMFAENDSCLCQGECVCFRKPAGWTVPRSRYPMKNNGINFKLLCAPPLRKANVCRGRRSSAMPPVGASFDDPLSPLLLKLEHLRQLHLRPLLLEGVELGGHRVVDAVQ